MVAVAAAASALPSDDGGGGGAVVDGDRLTGRLRISLMKCDVDELDEDEMGDMDDVATVVRVFTEQRLPFEDDDLTVMEWLGP